MIDDNEIREAAHLSTLADGEVALFVQNGFYKGAKWAEKKINRRRKSEIDWEQRKFEVAKELFLSLYQESSCNPDETPTQYVTRLTIDAIRGADAFLIEYQKSVTYNGK